jgi:hypothetical protein
MTAEVKRILDQCKAKGIILEPAPDGEHLDLHYQEPPPEDLRQMLRTHKAEILSLLKPQPPLWHAQEIANAVQKEGVCLFWSEVLQEVIAFAKDDKQPVPAGFVTYTSAELKELHKGKTTIAPETLRLIHAAKKAGGKVAESGDVLEC